MSDDLEHDIEIKVDALSETIESALPEHRRLLLVWDDDEYYARSDVTTAELLELVEALADDLRTELHAIAGGSKTLQ